MSERFKPFAAIYAILIKDGKVFLLRRYKTGWMDGYYGLPSGHLEKEEGVKAATVRETFEEAGVAIEEKDLELVHLMHRLRKGDREYLDMFFVASQWKGEPRVMEADKADECGWFAMDDLPENTVPSVRAAIDNHRKGVMYSEFAME